LLSKMTDTFRPIGMVCAYAGLRISETLSLTWGTHRSRQASVDLRLVKRDALIFTTLRGKPQSRRNALRALHAAGDAAGLNGDGLEPVGLHDLRHSLVDGPLDSGVTLAEAAVLARHANAKVTGAIYAGVSETAKAKIASKLVAAGFGA
jgi:integrase